MMLRGFASSASFKVARGALERSIARLDSSPRTLHGLTLDWLTGYAILVTIYRHEGRAGFVLRFSAQ
jgi:hypothetical protein